MTEEYECRCGCRFAYELGKYGCPSCGADDGPADLVAGMNDTLVGRDDLDPLHQRVVEAIFSGILWDTKEVTVESVASVIDLIRADERAARDAKGESDDVH